VPRCLSSTFSKSKHIAFRLGPCSSSPIYSSAYYHFFSGTFYLWPAFPTLLTFPTHLTGVLLAGALYGPWYSSSALKGDIRTSPTWLWSCVAVWAFAQISNFKVHLTLRDLRPPGTRTRAIPYGYGFNLVSFPNYMFEVLGWVVFTFMTRSWAGNRL